MKTQLPNKLPNKLSMNGFALVVTVSMLVLLTLVAVGLLSLSTISLRASSIHEARTRAEANARMALMIAIGELQQEMGADQRISANSDILRPDPNTIRHRHWTGAWDSWKAGECESSHHSTIKGVADDMAPSYMPNRADRFRKWLVSLNEAEAASLTSPMNVSLDAVDLPAAYDDAIFLVREGSLGRDAIHQPDYVAARLVDVADESAGQVSGRFAWWVGDESQKARVLGEPYGYEAMLTRTDNYYLNQAPATTGTRTIQGLENIPNEAQLAGLPSLKTLDLVTNVNGRPSQTNFHDVTPYSRQVLADVREGGMKRDLSAILERPINLEETGDEFMLYRFDEDGEARVPIQDLAAYYQLYHNDPEWIAERRQGVEYDDENKSFEIKVPDYGDDSTREKHLRQYASIYSSPIPVRMQFILALGATPITPQDRAAFAGNAAIRPTDTHKLFLGVIPVLSLWNPNNVALVIDQGNTQMFKLGAPPFAIRWQKHRPENDNVVNGAINLGYAMSGQSSGDGRATREAPYIMQFKLGQSNSVRFEPGEVKIFSFPSSAAGKLTDGVDGRVLNSAGNEFEPVNEWDPYGVFYCNNSAKVGNPNYPDAKHFTYNGQRRSCMVFKATDKINVEISAEGANLARIDGNNGGSGASISRMGEVSGAGFNFWMAGYQHVANARNSTTYHFRNYQAISRFGGRAGFMGGPGQIDTEAFNRDLMSIGFPDQSPIIHFESPANALPGSQIIAATQSGEAISFMVFSLMAGCEVHSSRVGGYAAGRKSSSRPFLHGATIAAPLIDKTDKTALYDFAWEWQIDKINAVEEVIQMNPGTGNCFWGSGYTIEAGATHVVQQHLPVLPPISIASMSSAQIGGFSLANQPVVAGADDDVKFKAFGLEDDPLRDANDPKSFQVVTATGAAGLAPHTMQAIGNSYAHPNVPADKASTTYLRELNIDAPSQEIPYVDHSYLANKALWDEYFFSSLVAQPYDVVPFYQEGRSLQQVADDFFSGVKPLPNRRIIPYKNNLNEYGLDQLIDMADVFQGGLADRIAAHLMVEGAFNVNSTSVEAWKVFLSSLRGKPVSYLEQEVLSEHAPEGTTVNGGILRNGKPVKTSDIAGMNAPPEQWRAGRELSDSEIEELAEAIVKQVKLRGPFLSLSEFVNRRLERNSPLAVKGALQAALDDPSVSINANFRTADRMLDAETSGISFVYPEAADGPIAYGSAAYVDQADILGHFAEQLAPRGDTFVIRTYGDALDGNGNVVARAWCEAVVQRVPEYVNPNDEAHLKQADPALSTTSKRFGRKILITRFRWLNANEV